MFVFKLARLSSLLSSSYLSAAKRNLSGFRSSLQPLFSSFFFESGSRHCLLIGFFLLGLDSLQAVRPGGEEKY
jgi:hypothetical protein